MIGGATAALEPRDKAAVSISRELELHGSPSLLLDHQSASPNIRPGYQTADLQLHQVTAAQLAFDGKVEQRAVSQPSFAVEKKTDCSDLLLGVGTLRADGRASRSAMSERTTAYAALAPKSGRAALHQP